MVIGDLRTNWKIDEIKHRNEIIRQWLRDKPVGHAFQPATHYPELRELKKTDLKAVFQYKRRLPHWELEGSTYFITFHVLPDIAKLYPLINPERLRYPTQNDPVGHAFQPASFQPAFTNLGDVGHAFQPASPPASIVEESIWFGYGERYFLDAYVVMPDHVHLLLTPLPEWRLGKILMGMKGYTAWEINKIIKRKGSYWQDENFDHLIRNEADWLDKFHYIHENPVRAGLVEKAEDYPFSSLVTLHARGRLESVPHILKSDIE